MTRRVLTRRQIEVLQLMADDVPLAEAAERLGMRPATARTHLQTALTRIGLHSQKALVAYAMRRGLIR